MATVKQSKYPQCHKGSIPGGMTATTSLWAGNASVETWSSIHKTWSENSSLVSTSD